MVRPDPLRERRRARGFVRSSDQFDPAHSHRGNLNAMTPSREDSPHANLAATASRRREAGWDVHAQEGSSVAEGWSRGNRVKGTLSAFLAGCCRGA